jgi:hypothetical protein
MLEWSWSNIRLFRSARHAAGQGGRYPHFRVGTDRSRQSTEKASVFAVDENISVAAKLALLIKHMVAEAGKLSRKML